jgi:hypothetical protein
MFYVDLFRMFLERRLNLRTDTELQTTDQKRAGQKDDRS